MTDVNTSKLHLVQLLSIPIDLWAQSQEHFQDLLREFALISASPSDSHPLPKRLLEIVDKLSGEFSQFTNSQNDQLIAAAEANQASIDLEFYLPLAVIDAAHELTEILDETDAYCAAGDHLLTLETPPQLREYREWYISEFVNQLQGKAPVAWPDRAK